jgi:hypothetical protein
MSGMRRILKMIKKIQVTLLVEVDTEDEFICPSGDPLLENCVVNVVEDRFFTDPVKILEVKEYKND